MAADSRYNVESRWRAPPHRRRGGRMSADPSSSPALRASDADRDRVVEVLRAAVADGRLDPAEFDERLDAALAARTIDALAPLTADLIAAPGSHAALSLPLGGTPAEPAAELLTINERHGSVRREGRWTLPHRLGGGPPRGGGVVGPPQAGAPRTPR